MHSFKGKTATFHYDGRFDANDLIKLFKKDELSKEITINNKYDLVLKEIPYGNRKIKYSYDVVENNSSIELKDVLPSRSVLNLLSKGYNIEFLDGNNNKLYVLGKVK